MMSLEDRIKNYYEKPFKIKLPMRMPVIMRLDGRAWHTYTRGLKRPFDDNLINAVNSVAQKLCNNIQGAQIAYTQSDEISILIHNYKKFSSSAWFDNQIQKMCSISAGIAASAMTLLSRDVFGKIRPTVFDSRVFIVPEAEVNNIFVQRQQDATRNSIQAVAQSLFSAKQLHKKNNSEMQEMIFQKGQNWNDYPIHLKRGRCIVKDTYTIKLKDGTECERTHWVVDNNIPIFSKDKNYIEKYLQVEEE